jgi:hypothetical protein
MNGRRKMAFGVFNNARSGFCFVKEAEILTEGEDFESKSYREKSSSG